MADLLFVAILIGFFGLAVLLVRACDAIIGPDPAPVDRSTGEEDGATLVEAEAVPA